MHYRVFQYTVSVKIQCFEDIMLRIWNTFVLLVYIYMNGLVYIFSANSTTITQEQSDNMSFHKCKYIIPTTVRNNRY